MKVNFKFNNGEVVINRHNKAGFVSMCAVQEGELNPSYYVKYETSEGWEQEENLRGKDEL